MALELTDANFKTEVLDSDKLTVIDFWAEWCGPCRAIGPVIEELSKEYEGKVNIGKLNVDNNPQVSMNYGITSIPAILFVKNGQVVDKLVGAQPKANFVKKNEALQKFNQQNKKGPLQLQGAFLLILLQAIKMYIAPKIKPAYER